MGHWLYLAGTECDYCHIIHFHLQRFINGVLPCGYGKAEYIHSHAHLL